MKSSEETSFSQQSPLAWDPADIPVPDFASSFTTICTLKVRYSKGRGWPQNLVLLSASLAVVQQCMEIPREVVKNGTTLNQQNSRDGSQNHVSTQAEMALQEELSILNIDLHIAEVNIFYIGYRLGMWVRKPHHHRNIILPTDHLDSKSIPPNNSTPYEPIIKTHESMASISIQTTTNRN